MANKRQQLQSTLAQFYNQPIAKVSLELLLSVGAVIFFAVFAIRPTLLTMSDLIKEIEDKEKLNLAMDRKIAALSTVQSEFFSLQKRLVVLDEAIPSSPQLETSLKIIEKIASDNRVVIRSIQIQELPPETELEIPIDKAQRLSIPISVSLTGDYLAIRQFIEDLRNTRRAFIVDSIVFSVSDERDQKKLTSTVTINAQYFGAKP